MTTWISISSPIDPSSTVTRTPRAYEHNFGDGYQASIPDGINNHPAQYTIQYKNVSPSEHTALVAFVNTHAAARTVLTVPILPEDSTGATTGKFRIQRSSKQAVDGAALYDWTIELQEVFGV